MRNRSLRSALLVACLAGTGPALAAEPADEPAAATAEPAAAAWDKDRAHGYGSIEQIGRAHV